MNPDYWLTRWMENRTGFHMQGVNPLLQRFWPEVAPAANGRVLVPLCGKSHDLRWLAERGHDVVGAELSPIAAKAFFSEQQIPFRESIEPPFTVFRAGRITYYVGDVLQLRAEVTGRFDFVYDRAALIALPGPMRQAYVRHLHSLWAPSGHELLISLEYDTSVMDGPPFSVSEDEVQTLFAGDRIVKLHEYDCLDDEPRFKERGLKWMKEVVYGVRAQP